MLPEKMKSVWKTTTKSTPPGRKAEVLTYSALAASSWATHF